MIHFSDKALARILRFVSKDEQAIGIYLHLIEKGCAGMSYDLDLAYSVGDGQLLIEQGDLTIVLDKAHISYFEDLSVDVVRKGMNETFSFSNPHITHSCHCGKSFSL